MAKKQSNSVRIIGGLYRRRRIEFPEHEGLRPTPDRVRETLFNWLGQEMHGQQVLDLFAGSGALGFEAASRGARRVVMVEMARSALAALKVGRTLLNADAVEVVAAEGLRYLTQTSEQFDVVFLDPPYSSDLLPRALACVAACLVPGGQVYIECAAWPVLDGWTRIKEGRTGSVHYAVLVRTPVV